MVGPRTRIKVSSSGSSRLLESTETSNLNSFILFDI